ncbi:AEC family transporter [Hydrogenovibrio sp. 3SP14C1]|uniref:AEC family transporter n=1 Tax=Hydrogenovibrio sp. 3SP14C1 TaxID=3038774 RepID=UPI0024160C28|nr:AEC family transporter [Hydrogenovibrio sp. 3SP14C1]MDG4812287.1 AEC family transporter [Hydrogenovibrio sp. 3SP14C1]
MSSLSAIPSILILIALISLVVLVRKIGIVKQENGALFAQIVTHLTLPATIFYALSHAQDLQWDYALVVLFILGTEVILLAFAWWIGRQLKLPKPKLGSLMLVSAFGSSALLGYAIVEQVFPTDLNAISEAVFISELGVGVGLFTVGTLVAIYFGGHQTQSKITALQSLLTFTKSPIFISIVLGILYGQLQLPLDGIFFTEIFNAVHLIAQANTFFVVLTIGVMLEFSGFKHILVLAVVAIILKLIISPILVWLPTLALPLQQWQMEVILLESAMPSAMLSVVLAKRYGCDAHLASRLVYITTLASAMTILFMLGILR